MRTASDTNRTQMDSDGVATRPERVACTPQGEGGTPNGLSAAEEHAREAAKRDELAKRRDMEAAERDHAAEMRDHEIAMVGELVPPDGPVTERLRVQLRDLLAEAEADRARAAADRARAAKDRARAAEERASDLALLRGAQFDDLTGAYRRGFGEDVLSGELDRVRRSGERLVLVMVDVDGLKEVNDMRGHLAGDALLQDLVAAIRANVRSYEPIVRLGGDEFAFTIGGVDRDEAEARCAAIRADLARRPSHGSITVGIGELCDGDQFVDLFRRADSALLEARPERLSRSR